MHKTYTHTHTRLHKLTIKHTWVPFLSAPQVWLTGVISGWSSCLVVIKMSAVSWHLLPFPFTWTRKTNSFSNMLTRSLQGQNKKSLILYPFCPLRGPMLYGFQFPAYNVLEVCAAFFQNQTLIFFLCFVFVFIICIIFCSLPSVMVGELPRGTRRKEESLVADKSWAVSKANFILLGFVYRHSQPISEDVIVMHYLVMAAKGRITNGRQCPIITASPEEHRRVKMAQRHNQNTQYTEICT